MITNNNFSDTVTFDSNVKGEKKGFSLDSSILSTSKANLDDLRILTKIEKILSTNIQEVLVIRYNKSGFKI